MVYASAGLVWKEYGGRCAAHIASIRFGLTLSEQQAQGIAYAIDSDLVQYLDMADTGAARNAPGSYGLSAVISGFNPSWLDEQRAVDASAADELKLTCFRRAVDFMKEIIANAISYRVGALHAVDQVRQAERMENGRLLYLKNAALPWSSIVRHEMPDVLFVISFSIAEQRPMLHTVPASADSFLARKDLPASWAGLNGAELAAITGVPDAMFCHNGRFIAAAGSFEGALQMARLALAE